MVLDNVPSDVPSDTYYPSETVAYPKYGQDLTHGGGLMALGK